MQTYSGTIEMPALPHLLIRHYKEIITLRNQNSEHWVLYNLMDIATNQ